MVVVEGNGVKKFAFYSWDQDNSLWRHLVNVFLRKKGALPVHPILLTVHAFLLLPAFIPLCE